MLLTAAAHQRLTYMEMVGRKDESAGAFGATQFMGGKDHRVGFERGKAAGDPPCRLHGVANDEPVFGVDETRGLRHRLDHARFVTGSL
jgi:hypothetical protein